MSDANHGTTIDSVLREDRVFPPPAGASAPPRIVAQPGATTTRSTGARSTIPRASGPSRPRELHWCTPWDQVLDWTAARSPSGSSAAQLNVADNCLDRHLARAAPEQGRASSGRASRATRRVAHLPGAAPRGLPLRQRAARRSASRRAIASRIYMPMIPERRSRCSPARASAPRTRVVFGGFSRRGARATASTTRRPSSSSPPTAAGGAAAIVPLKANVDARRREVARRSRTSSSCSRTGETVRDARRAATTGGTS